MVRRILTRRDFGLGLSALTLATSSGARAEGIVDLEWSDLIPAQQALSAESVFGIMSHDQGALVNEQPPSSGVRTEWNGREIRISGFVIPLEYSGAGVTTFLLVPYVGACIHVPPPPANQLILVTTADPYDDPGLFAPVTVTGMFGNSATSTQLAMVGYALSADEIRPYDG